MNYYSSLVTVPRLLRPITLSTLPPMNSITSTSCPKRSPIRKFAWSFYVSFVSTLLDPTPTFVSVEPPVPLSDCCRVEYGVVGNYVSILLLFNFVNIK